MFGIPTRSDVKDKKYQRAVIPEKWASQEAELVRKFRRGEDTTDFFLTNYT